jgi:nitrous oxidase accessory protein NosD
VRAAALLLAASVAACATAPPAARDLHDMPVRAITGEETWEGRVVVDRIVIVRRGGHLTLRPGTKVLFRRVDWDGDGVGDAEITVEGRLTAVGTPEAPILLDSAEPEPAPSDWKYLHVNFAEGARLAYVRCGHAYSGLQVHYSEATVERCEFRHNVDGVRFSTARLTVEGCWIRQNRNGVRYEERGNPARVAGNDISLNDVGIFAVTRCLGRSTFAGNDIAGNATPVKMGLEQRESLAFPGNWWGPDPAAADAAIVDGRIDPHTGRVRIDPPLAAPVGVARPFALPDDPDWQRAARADR